MPEFIARLWCRYLHRGVYRPVRGQYRCSQCLRVWPVLWEQQEAGPKKLATAVRIPAVAALFFLALAASSQAQIVRDVHPDGGKVGTVLRAHGEGLNRDKVIGIYLSDQTLDMMAKVMNQSDDVIEFRIPPSVKPGRLQIVLKTAGKDPHLLEQPYYITVEGSKEPGEVTAGSK